MAQQPPSIEFQDIPLEEARRMGRGPRMDPVLYEALTEKLQSLGDTAVRMNIPEDTSPTTMKNRILRVSTQLEIPVTIRRVPGGLLFWRTTDEDLQPAKPVVQPLPNPQPSRQSTRRGGRRPA